MNDEKLKWKLVKSEHIVKDQWIDFRRETYEFPDGSVFGPYYNYSRKSYSVIIAETTEGKFLCVRQYRHGIRQITTEFPAGGIEAKGKVNFSTALKAAKRELQEETGYISDDWTYLMKIPNDATLGDNYGYIFYAEKCHQVSEQKLDDTEFVERIQLSGNEIDSLIKKEQFQQAVHVMAWYYLKEKENSKKKKLQIVDGKQYLDQIRNLIIEYTGRLNRVLSFQNIDEELKNPAQKYTPPEGEILAAVDQNGTVRGMVAYHRHSEKRCEMKRLYVQPDIRGEHLGFRLISAIIEHARKAGYQEMVLDTIKPLHSAIHLYHQFGFQECEPYYNNPMKDVVYMKKDLNE